MIDRAVEFILISENKYLFLLERNNNYFCNKTKVFAYMNYINVCVCVFVSSSFELFFSFFVYVFNYHQLKKILELNLFVVYLKR